MRKKLGISSLGLLALFVTQCAVVYALQSDWAKTQVEQQWQSTRVVKTANLSATRSLQILPLFVGGLHYEGLTSDQTQPHLSFVASLKPQFVTISPHDSSPAALQGFHEAFPVAYRDLAVGRSINFGR